MNRMFLPIAVGGVAGRMGLGSEAAPAARQVGSDAPRVERDELSAFAATLPEIRA